MKRERFKIYLFICIFLFIVFSGGIVYGAEAQGIIDGMIYNIKNIASGKCLNVNLATDANGTNVNQWTEDGSQEQKFRVIYYPRELAYRMYVMCSSKGANRVLDVLRVGGSASGAIQSGCNVDIWTKGDNDCQLFVIKEEGNEKYSIRLKANQSLVLTSYGTENGSGTGKLSTSKGNVFIDNWSGSNNQLWSFKSIGETPAYPYRMTKGIGEQNLFIDSTASRYINFISSGAAKWSPTIIMGIASDNSATAVDFYSTDDKDYYDSIQELGDYWAAATTRHIPSTSNVIDSNDRGWSFGMVRINNNVFMLERITEEIRRGTIAHEIGHAFGLKHYDNTNSVMYPETDKGVTSPQNIDRKALTSKY